MTGVPDRIERAADLIDRLLEDPAFRAAFRRRPAAGARAYGLGDVAEALDRSERPLQTLDGRESRSSLAGALMAAAAEGVEVADLVRGQDGFDGEAVEAVRRAATRREMRVLASPGDEVPASKAPQAPAEEPPRTPRLRPVVEERDKPADGGADLSDYPGDDASKAQIAAWMAHAARKAGLPPELPVIAALQESGLRNLDYGHADSLGFFQMRLQYWNTGPWRGYPDKPELQLRWFIQRALEERKEHPGVYKNSSDYGRWAADIEQCREDLRGLYQGHMREARRLIEEGGGQARRHDAPARDASPREPVLPGTYGAPLEPGAYGAPALSGAGLHPALPKTTTDYAAGQVALVTPGPKAPPVVSDTEIGRATERDPEADGKERGSAGERMVSRAQRELERGVVETSDDDSPRISVYRAATAGAPGPGPWCAYFVSWLAKESGAPLGSEGQGFGRVDDVWAWAESAGRAVPTGTGKPHPGDLIVWDEHIGIVEKVLPDGQIQTIEGNTSQRVGRRVYPAGTEIGFVRMP